MGLLEGGFGFCNVVFGWDSSDLAYEGMKYTGWHTGYPDAVAKLDLGTYRTSPGITMCRFSWATSILRSARGIS